MVKFCNIVNWHFYNALVTHDILTRPRRPKKIARKGQKSAKEAPNLAKLKTNKFYSVERKLRHLYSFNSCILYTWVSVEALNNLYKLPLHTPNSQSLWVDLYPKLFLSSLLYDVVFFMCIAAIYVCVAAHGARHTWFLQLTITVLFQLFFK